MSHILDCFTEYDHVILSEETLWRCLHKRDQLAKTLKAHADAHGYRINIIVYLRRQDEFLISCWKQKVKHVNKALKETFSEYREEVLKNESYLLEYAARLDELAEVFGHDNLIVRCFQPDSWINGSLIDDFLHCIGLEHTNDFVNHPNNFNPSLSENMAYIKLTINNTPSFSAQEIAYLGHLIRDLSAVSTTNYPCSMLSTTETHALLEQFENENACVARNFFHNDGPLFSEHVKNVPQWQPDNPYMQEDMIRFFSSAIINIYRENESLRNDLKDLQQVVESERSRFRIFKQKLKHPFRTLIHLLFSRQTAIKHIKTPE